MEFSFVIMRALARVVVTLRAWIVERNEGFTDQQ